MLRIGGGAALVAAIVAVFVVATQGRDPDLEALEHEGREYILQMDKAAGLRRNRASVAEWAYTSNITKENEEKKVEYFIAKGEGQEFILLLDKFGNQEEPGLQWRHKSIKIGLTVVLSRLIVIESHFETRTNIIGEAKHP